MPANMKIKSAYSSLPAAERRVADYILANPDRVPLMVINDIASEAGVSVPSVTRLARKLGYASFLDFRVALASSAADSASGATSPLSANDSADVAAGKLFTNTIKALEETGRALDRKSLAALASKIAASKRTIVFAHADAASVAADFSERLARCGCDATFAGDNARLNACLKHADPGFVLVALSCGARGRDMIDALRAASSCGASTALMSGSVTSPAAQLAEHFFFTARADDEKSVTGSDSIVSMAVVCDVLSSLVARVMEKK